MKIKAIFLLLFILTLFTSCGKEYTYIPPQSEAGKLCVHQCQNQQSLCRENEIKRATEQYQACSASSSENFNQCKIKKQKDFNQCEHDAKIEFIACQRYAHTLSERGLCQEKICMPNNSCVQQVCYNSASYDFCDSEFRGCFQQCGGKVGVMDN